MSSKSTLKPMSISIKSISRSLSRDSAWMPLSRLSIPKNVSILSGPTLALAWQAKILPKPKLLLQQPVPLASKAHQLQPMWRVSCNEPKKISSKGLDKWSNKAKENGNKENKKWKKRLIDNQVWLKMLQRHYPMVGKKSRKSGKTYMKPLHKKSMKWLPLKQNKKLDKQRKNSKKAQETLRKALRM